MHPPIRVYYEDNHILVVHKPAGLPVQRDRSGDADFLELLKEDLKLRYEKPGNVYLGLVHRLDRPVSGIMVFAKTSKAASRISEQVRTHRMEKVYFAVIYGKLEKKSATLQDFLYKDEKNNRVSIVPENFPNAKYAELEYNMVDFQKGYSLVEIRLISGRPHQIRVQFSGRGYPLLGDVKYGNPDKNPLESLALFSYKLRLEHPTLKKRMEFVAEIPFQFPWNLFEI